MDCKTIALCLNGRHMLQLLVPSASAISLAPAARSTPDGSGKVDIEGRRSERIYTYDVLHEWTNEQETQSHVPMSIHTKGMFEYTYWYLSVHTIWPSASKLMLSTSKA